jgi:hypothetical protein
MTGDFTFRAKAAAEYHRAFAYEALRREEMRTPLSDTGGPIAIEVEYRIASGGRQQ